MLKYGLSIALLGCATAALAQNAQAPSAPPAAAPAMTPQQSAIQAAAMGFAQCVMAGVQALPASVAAQAGATSVLAGCTAQRQQLDQAAEGYIGTLPQDQQAAAREQYRTQIAGAEGQIAARITQMRAAPPAAAPAQ
jgi:hypothetical protein